MPSIESQLKDEIGNLNKAFSDFKDENEKLIKDQDKVQSDKVDVISNSINDIEDKIDMLEKDKARGELPNELQATRDEYTDKFFNSFMRKGIDDEMDSLAIKAELSVSVGTEGGVTIPEETDRDILKLAEDMSPIRQYATVRTIGGADYRKLVQFGNVGSGWVGEKAARPETGTPTFSSITPSMGEVYANPATTQKLLDDAFFNIETFLTQEGIEEFVKQENIAFVTGDGTNKPIGLLAGAMAATSDGSRPFGTIQTIASGVAAGLPADVTAYDLFLDAMDELKDQHEPNAVYMMHPRTKTVVRKIKDNDNRYVWEPNVKAGESSTIFGVPVATNSNFPVLAANSLAILYGDLKRAFTIIDRMGTRVLRDPYTNKPYVHFYMTKRVGSMLVDSEAVKIIQCKL